MREGDLARRRDRGGRGTREVARRTRMTKPTAGNALELLRTAGLVREAEPPGDVHYGAVCFEPVPDVAHVLGLDIGTRYVRGALSDLTGAVVAASRPPPRGPTSPSGRSAAASARGGRPHRGHRGAAGEVDDPPPGATEAPASPSGDALAALAHEWIARGETTRLSAPVTAEDVFAAAAEGDGLARRLLAEESRRIAEISRITDVELIVLGGGLGLAADSLLPAIRAGTEHLLRFPPRIEISRLGDGPVLAGALAHGTRLAAKAVAVERISGAG